jgi:hypothetical protein
MRDGIATCMAGGVVAGCFSPTPTEVGTVAGRTGSEARRLHPFSMESIVFRISPPIRVWNCISSSMTGSIVAGYIHDASAEVVAVAILAGCNAHNRDPVAMEIDSFGCSPVIRMRNLAGAGMTVVTGLICEAPF